MVRRFNYCLDETQALFLREVARDGCMSASELLRRMIDYCLQQDEVLNQIAPQISGRMITR